MVHVFPIAVMDNNKLHVGLVSISLATLSRCKSKHGQKGGKIRAAKRPHGPVWLQDPPSPWSW